MAFISYAHSQKIGSTNNLNVFYGKKPKGQTE
jgi:hypothetical protein